LPFIEERRCAVPKELALIPAFFPPGEGESIIRRMEFTYNCSSNALILDPSPGGEHRVRAGDQSDCMVQLEERSCEADVRLRTVV
jgi:hypothetical protein